MSTSTETTAADPEKSTETSKNGDTSTGPETTATQATDAAGDEENTNGTSISPESTSTEASGNTGGGRANTNDTSSGPEATSPRTSEIGRDAEDADTSTNPQDATQEATETAGSPETASAENGSCIEVTLPDVLGIGKCMEANLDLCQNENTLIPGVMTLVNCTVTSLFNNLTPKNFFITVKDILVALISKLVPGVVRIAEKYLDGMESGEDKTIANGTCDGEIKIGIPNSLGKCLDKTLKLCEKGKPIDVAVLESLVKALGCILKDLLTTAPHETLKNLLCDLVRLVADLIGNPVKTAVTAFCSI